MTRVLFIKTSSMGDVVHHMPVIADLRQARPDVRIDWVVEEGYADLVRLVRGVERVIPVAWRRWRRAPTNTNVRAERRAFVAALRETAYDLVLDTQGLVKSAWIARRARVAAGGVRAGFALGLVREPLARLFYDRAYGADPGSHAIERMRSLAAQALGYADRDLGPPRFELDVPPRTFAWLAADRPYAVLLHATARPEKAWPADRWMSVVLASCRQGMTVVLPWGSVTEERVARTLAATAVRAGSANVVVAPALSLVDCAALLSGATVVVGVDTGLLHLAVALDAPTVGLFGATPRWRYAPYWTPRAISLADENGGKPAAADVVDALARLGVLTP